jgi:ABC-type transporter Mla MlaB component
VPQEANAFHLHGEQTVRSIAETHLALAEHYASAASVAIDASAVTEADLTFVQLILSLRRTAERDGKRACITGPLPDCLRDTLVRGGFLTTPDSHLFWTSP